MSKKSTHIGTISKLDLLHAPTGHAPHITGTGVHRDKRKQPKGGRSRVNKKAIHEHLG